MTLVLCWDIDGTLLTTARAGIFAWEDAVEEHLGVEVSLQDYETAGLTDVEIGRMLVEEITGERDDPRADAMTRRYAELLPSRLHRRQGRVLDNVKEILEVLQRRDDVLSILLTGNVAAGGRAKLAHYGLADYFEHGAFSDETPDRGEIARRARQIAEDELGEIDDAALCVIGDTPHDIRCGKLIGARTVAVASGSYTREQLGRHDPWWLLPRLPSPARFLEHLRDKSLSRPATDVSG